MSVVISGGQGKCGRDHFLNISYLALKKILSCLIQMPLSLIFGEPSWWGHTGEGLAEKKSEMDSCPCSELFYLTFNLRINT